MDDRPAGKVGKIEVSKLSDIKDRSGNGISQCALDRRYLLELVKEMREVLKWYAEEAVYNDHNSVDICAGCDEGTRASNVLAKLREE